MAILTINSGSSSLKFGLYDETGSIVLLAGKAEGIGEKQGSLSLTGQDGAVLEQMDLQLATQNDALARVSELLTKYGRDPVTAIGHRMVHGGPHLREHCVLTEAVLKTLEDSVHFAPLHIPAALDLVRATEVAFPQAKQFACFDTQFHSTLPAEAYTYAIPKKYRDAGVRRYGFHGLSYASLVRRMGEDLRPRTVAAHLGGGSSLCALASGRSVDTSMGLSPCGGVPMATRSGDLDPGVGMLLQRRLNAEQAGLTVDELEVTLNKASGMLALAGESDTRALTQRADAGDAEARLAVEIFTREIAKGVAGYASVLGGLDMLVFTGGIGEHSRSIRTAICDRLTFLGMRLDPSATGAVLHAVDSTIQVWVEAADEDGEIALEVSRLLRNEE